MSAWDGVTLCAVVIVKSGRDSQGFRDAIEAAMDPVTAEWTRDYAAVEALRGGGGSPPQRKTGYLVLVYAPEITDEAEVRRRLERHERADTLDFIAIERHEY